MTRPPQQRPEDDAWMDRMLDDLASAPVPDMSDDFMSRIMADAQAQLPAPGGSAVRAPWWRQLVDGLGGWPALGGVVAAAATGFVIGFGGFEGAAMDALWTPYDATYYEGGAGYDAFGWDIEEG